VRKSTEKGSVLISVLILVIVVVLIMGAVAGFINRGIQRTRATSARLQALYLAEAGVDKAIEQLKEDWNITVPTPWPSSPPTPTPSYSPFPTSPLSDDKVGEYGFIIPPDEGSGERKIEGYGKVEVAGREIEEKVEVVVKLDKLTFNYALFAGNSINLGSSPKIKGDVATNAGGPGSVNLSWGAQIEGDLYVGPGTGPLGPGVDSDYVVTIPEYSTENHIKDGDVKRLKKEIVYPPPEFPDYPTGLPNRGEFALDNGVTATISADGYYKKIDITGGSKLYIDTGSDPNDERIILVDESFSLSNNGEVILNGSGKLKLYVKKTFQAGGGATFNYVGGKGDPSRVTIYYGGTGDFNLLNKAKINGTVVVNNANVNIDGSAVLKGNLIAVGDEDDEDTIKEITMKGDPESAEVCGVVYAPNYKVTLSNSGNVEGAVVCKEFSSSEVSGIDEIVLKYDTSVIEATPFPADVLPSGGSGGISITRWESKMPQ